MSTSANAGKVMMGADGCPLVGHDGKIVLADSIYPARLWHWDTSGWYRNAGGVQYVSHTPLIEADCVSPVWDQTWAPEDGGEPLGWRTGVSYYRTVSDIGTPEAPLWSVFHDTPQSVQKITSHSGPGHLAVPWSRVNKVTINWRVWARSGTASPYATNYAIGTASATLPSGANEPWTGSGWTHIATVQPDGSQDMYDTLASGSFTFTPTVDGLTWYLGIYASEPGGTGSVGSYNVSCHFNWWDLDPGFLDPTAPVDYPRVIYNLAT